MAKIIYDYTAEEVQADIDSGRNFELEHNEDRLLITMPFGMLNMVLTAKDGVLMASEHQAKLRNYVNIIGQNANGTHVIAYLRVNGSMAGTGIRGMKGNQINALLSKIPSSIKNKTDQDVIDNFIDPDTKSYYPYSPPLETPDFDSMSWTDIKQWIRDNDNSDNYDLRKELDTRTALDLKHNS